MPRRRFERIGLAQLLTSRCAVVLGACVLFGHAQAQQPSVPTGPVPAPPTQSPVVNPSNPGTAQQPSYTPLQSSTPSTTPSTPSGAPSGELTPGHEATPSTTVRSERSTSAANTRPIHHHYYYHHHRGRLPLETYSCSHLGCVRTYAWAFPCQYYSRYCYPYGVAALAPWWPGYYDYAPGKFGRGRPRYGG
jgi:hypothetical protein